MALEGSAGVKSFELNTAIRQASITYDPGETTVDTIITNIKKKTRYTTIDIRES